MSKPKDEKNELTLGELEMVSGSISLLDQKAVQLPQPPESTLATEISNIMKQVASTESNTIKNIR
jgi:hypothetical protein